VSPEADKHDQDFTLGYLLDCCSGVLVRKYEAMDDVNGFGRGGSHRIQGLGPRHEEEDTALGQNYGIMAGPRCSRRDLHWV
jgi:hypothetical protein